MSTSAESSIFLPYLDLLSKILIDGEEHDDRTGVGTLSLFGEQIRFDLRKGFPLMTTKKLPLRWIAEELFWLSPAENQPKACIVRGIAKHGIFTNGNIDVRY